MGQSDLGDLLDRLHRSHLDERRRVARELHDVLAPALLVVMHELELSEAARRADPARAEQKVDSAREHLRWALELLRGLARDLHRGPSGSSLAEQLDHYLRAVGLREVTSVRIDGPEPQLAAALRGELYLVLREALCNACRHAAATHIEVSVRVRPGEGLSARVRDNGVGLDPARLARGGMGVLSMRERVAALGGAITVGEARGGGTEVTVDLPLPSTS